MNLFIKTCEKYHDWMQLTVKTMFEKLFLEKIYVFKYTNFFKYELYNKMKIK